MAQQVARAETTSPSVASNGVHKLDALGLGLDWTVLRECRLGPSGRSSAPTILIHPDRGVAVLDLQPSATPDAAEAVRAKLEAARFDGIFAGYLPVVNLRATPRQLPSLPKLLDDAFAGAPPLSLPDGEAWVGVAAWALQAEQAPAPPRRVEQSAPRRVEQPAPYRFEPEPPRAAVEKRAGRRPQVRRRRRRGAALRKAAVGLLCLAALGGVVAVVANDLPALDAFVRASLLPAAGTTPDAPPPPAEASLPREAAASVAPAAVRAEPTFPAPTGTGPTTPVPPTFSSAPPAPESSTRATPEPAAAAATPPRRPEAPQPPQASKPSERAAPAPQQQRRQQQEAGAGAASAGGGIVQSDPTAQRCRRVASRIGSGAPLGEADMRFFNEACIRW
jgi:hypothetical protein